MIVTFHLAVYFVYYVWNTYISHYTTENENESSNSGMPQHNNDNQASGANTNVVSNESRNENINRNRPLGPDQVNTNNSGNVGQSTKTENIRQGKEGEGDFHPCLPLISFNDEDKGNALIYNVEPEYVCISDEEKIKFFPPVYIQRYLEIQRILKDQRWADTIKKVIDFGCAELKFVTNYLKKMDQIEEIVGVDIDSGLLEDNCCKVSTFPNDFLKKRPTPLSIRVFCGSVAHTHNSLSGADAVTAIELIEHLFPPELECLPFTIFGFIKPKIAIFTTPNSDFNVLFKGMSGFRHPDHKFEWTQQQFEDWANNLVQRYPAYQVSFRGIGPGPKGSEKYGCCSQMATFVKISDKCSIASEEIHVQDGPYVLIRENDFPYFKDERTEEEKIKDAAAHFLTSWKMRSRVCDEVDSEIPIQSVMERIKYYDKEKLVEILKASGWQIEMNQSCEEVVVFPDSDSEEEDSELELNEYVTNHFENDDTKALSEEDWDQIGVDMDMTLTCDQEHPLSETSCVLDDSCHVVETFATKANLVDSTNITSTGSDKLGCSPSEKCFMSESTVPDTKMSDKYNSSQIDCFPEKDSNLNFEKSIYETPYNNGLSENVKSDCDLCDSSLPLSNQIVKNCKRSLMLESPNEFTQCEADTQSEDPFYCLSTVSSPCDTSIYATPCCSQRHSSSIPKCLSLQQISTHCDSPAFSTELERKLKEGKLVKDQKDNFSTSMDGFKSMESDLTCSSTSRVIDSGYPDSYSECNMDMDLTPEQFDDIETESDENDASSRSLSPAPPPPQIPWLIDDVQNGDVVNNNRDGEGNNLVADMEEELIEFEARIDEINNEVLNLAAANDAINFDSNLKSDEPPQEICGDCLPCISDHSLVSGMANEHPDGLEKSASSDLMKLKTVFVGKSTETPFGDSLDKLSLRSTKSDTSIATNYSWNVDPSENETHSEGGSCRPKKQNKKLKTLNSLTTVLDGRSKFSNCSLIRPVEVYQVSINHFPESVSTSMPNENVDSAQPGSSGTADVPTTVNVTSTGLQEDRQSITSVYQSAESLINTNGLQTENRNENTSFPDWLLKILLSETIENEVESLDSVQVVWDSDSQEFLNNETNYDVQVDARGGGDPLRDTWH